MQFLQNITYGLIQIQIWGLLWIWLIKAFTEAYYRLVLQLNETIKSQSQQYSLTFNCAMLAAANAFSSFSPFLIFFSHSNWWSSALSTQIYDTPHSSLCRTHGSRHSRKQPSVKKKTKNKKPNQPPLECPETSYIASLLRSIQPARSNPCLTGWPCSRTHHPLHLLPSVRWLLLLGSACPMGGCSSPPQL